MQPATCLGVSNAPLAACQTITKLGATSTGNTSRLKSRSRHSCLPWLSQGHNFERPVKPGNTANALAAFRGVVVELISERSREKIGGNCAANGLPHSVAHQAPTIILGIAVTRCLRMQCARCVDGIRERLPKLHARVTGFVIEGHAQRQDYGVGHPGLPFLRPCFCNF